MDRLKRQSNGPLYNNTMIGTLAVDWWVITFGAARKGLGGLRPPPQTPLHCTNVTAHPSTASVPIIVLLYNGPLLWRFNVPIKGLTDRRTGSRP